VLVIVSTRKQNRQGFRNQFSSPVSGPCAIGLTVVSCSPDGSLHAADQYIMCASWRGGRFGRLFTPSYCDHVGDRLIAIARRRRIFLPRPWSSPIQSSDPGHGEGLFFVPVAFCLSDDERATDTSNNSGICQLPKTFVENISLSIISSI